MAPVIPNLKKKVEVVKERGSNILVRNSVCQVNTHITVDFLDCGVYIWL